MCLYWAIEISIGLISIVDQKSIESQKLINMCQQAPKFFNKSLATDDFCGAS